ncbi:Zn-dependent M16 (insulinase) family peptidase [Aequitasia blattaphilus]|uniref:Insulinase family protein n=1 Tax=Aequitasia blattaphilus TaxID=2949332 RepID=A0ABT1EAC3_9FIRM|nr:insulinase family protein [Aequitasia blattaphilus]MCP1102753.1 insulinase family protein [Aequitasia blattaphilus]MCR8615393.1 insulinase family protein [Aequitasia blattaphilus]
MVLEKIEAYELLQEKEIKGIASTGYVFRHKKSGARVLYIENNDSNKVFTIGFRTPPKDSTGLPHILEHSVLCGSKKYPAKDPFVELVKGSLNTFLNAMTYPDKTVYPVASQNDKDFQNLMNVYLDAVFYPKIYEREEIFRQEGWSYKLEKEEDALQYNGVVYNEMKGAFSSPEGVLDRRIVNALFPDTTYANESGGDPEEIPNLTYEEFLDFHRAYYHPSNSYIYLYGDLDIEEKLKFIDEEYLNDFEYKKIDSEIQMQEPFKEIQDKEFPYSISQEESMKDNTYLSYNRVVGTNLDKELYLAFQVLDYVLLSSPGAILKKNLIEAGIGKDILGGYDNGVLQPFFSVVAKGANKEDEKRFLEVIENTLAELVENKIELKALEAGINYQEFQYREADFGGYPKGLIYGLEVFDSWLYDDQSVFTHLDALDTFAFLREKIGTDYYENLIQKYLIDNTHGVNVRVIPEQGRTTILEKELEESLRLYKESLGKEELEELVLKTKRLEEYQNEEEALEDIEKIPLLKREDLTKKPQLIANEKMELNGVPLLFHEINTNGIGYLNFIFDTNGIGEEDLPYLGLLQGILGLVDTKNYTYGELSNEINVHTGGVGTHLDTYVNVNDPVNSGFKATFEVKTKALYDKLEVSFDMVKEILLHSNLEDEKRIKEIISMSTSRLLMKFQQAGHSTAVSRASSYSSVIGKYKELTSGIDYYQFLAALLEDYDNRKEEMVSKLRKILVHVFRKENLLISFTAEREGLEGIHKKLPEFTDLLFVDERKMEAFQPVLEKKNEGFKSATKVQYAAQCGNFMKVGESYKGTLQILKVILGYDYLWQNIRVKGGAYGAMCGFNRIGEGFLTSYRDPNLKETYEVYQNTVDYIKNFQASDRELTKYIIGTMSNLDQPMTPATKGERSKNLYLSNISYEMLVKEREDVLGATVEEIRELYKVVEAVLAAKQICCIGSEEKITENKELFNEVKGF